ncbi:MAG: sigma-54 dependent transcriptional regulator [Balneolaceae bacterium]
MTSGKETLLITDDEQSIRNTLREILEFEGYGILEASGGEEALALLEKESVDLMLLDIKMQGMDGLEVLTEMQDRELDVPVILISGHGSIEIAVEATRRGAWDFLEKPPDLNRLLVSIRNALRRRQLQQENRQMRSRLYGESKLVGKSRAMEQVREVVRKVAPSPSRVLITGENGTGKEMVALMIHERSRRSDGPFVAVNCAAIPAELLESELFGHEKGAFTGADRQRIGKFEQAEGGTLFLDEIGDMSPEAQAKVLRVLQESRLVRVGGSEEISVDVRVVAATNKDLQEEIAGGRFREDLFHRLNVIPIHVPPLRERREDIPPLAGHFLEQLASDEILYAGRSFDEGAMEALEQMIWPGNVRELQNVVERLVLLSGSETITRADVETYVQRQRKTEQELDELIERSRTFQDFKEEAERLFLLRKLEENGWNVSQTAEAIDIQRSHVYNKMKKYNIEK